MDKFIESKVGAYKESWSTALRLSILTMKKFLAINANNLRLLRLLADSPTPLPQGITCKKVYIPRDFSITITASNTQHENVEKEDKFVKAEFVWNYRKQIESTPKPGQSIILYLHGGGYFICSRKTLRTMSGSIAKKTDSVMLVPSYRRAPENPFPLALQDSISCYLYLLKAYPDNPIYIGGDSAGGGLAISTLLWLKDSGKQLPTALFAMSPWLDLTLSTPSFILNRPFDYLTGMVGNEDGKTRISDDRTHHYCTSDSQLYHPYVSPLYYQTAIQPGESNTDTGDSNADNIDDDGFCPILIQVGSAELLRDESLTFYSKTFRSVNKIRVEMYQDMVHVFQLFSPIEKLSRVGLDNIAKFLNDTNSNNSDGSGANNNDGYNDGRRQTRNCVNISKTGGTGILSSGGGDVILEEPILDPMAIVMEGKSLLEDIKLHVGIEKSSEFEKLLPVVPEHVPIPHLQVDSDDNNGHKAFSIFEGSLVEHESVNCDAVVVGTTVTTGIETGDDGGEGKKRHSVCSIADRVDSGVEVVSK